MEPNDPMLQPTDLQKDLRRIFDNAVPDFLVADIALHIQNKYFSSRQSESSLCLNVQSATSLKAVGDCIAKEAASCYRLPQKHFTITAASDCTSHFDPSPVLLGRVGSCCLTGQLLLSDSTTSIACFTATNMDCIQRASHCGTGPHLTTGYIGSWILIWRFRLVIELGLNQSFDCSSCCLSSSGSRSLATAYVMFDVRDAKRVLAPQRLSAIAPSGLTLLEFKESENHSTLQSQVQRQLPHKLEHHHWIKLPSSVLVIGKESFKRWHDKQDSPASFVIRLCSSTASISKSDCEKTCVASPRSFSLELVAEARKCMAFVHIGQCYILKEIKERRCSQRDSAVSDLFIDDFRSLEEPVNVEGLPPGVVLGTTLPSAKVGTLVTCRAVVTAIEERYSKQDVAGLREETYRLERFYEGSSLRRQSRGHHWLLKLKDVEQNAFTAEAVVFDHCFVRHVRGIVPGSVVLMSDFLYKDAAADGTTSCVLVSTTVSSIELQTCPPVDSRTLKEQLRSSIQESEGRIDVPLSFVWPMYADDTNVTVAPDTFAVHGRLAHAISLSLAALCIKCSEVMVNDECRCASSPTRSAAYSLKAKLFGIFDDGSCEFFGYIYDGGIPALLDLSTATWVAIGSHVARHGSVDISSFCLEQQVDGLPAVLLKLVKSRTFGAHKQLTVIRLSSAVRNQTGVYTVPYKACLDAERKMWTTYITKKHGMMTVKITEVNSIRYI